jgi:hypothetical protein
MRVGRLGVWSADGAADVRIWHQADLGDPVGKGLLLT